MRTTLTIEPDLAQEIERRRKASGRTLKRVINDLLRAGVEQTKHRPAPVEEASYTQAHSCGKILVDPSTFDRTGELLARMDEEELGVAR